MVWNVISRGILIQRVQKSLFPHKGRLCKARANRPSLRGQLPPRNKALPATKTYPKKCVDIQAGVLSALRGKSYTLLLLKPEPHFD